MNIRLSPQQIFWCKCSLITPSPTPSPSRSEKGLRQLFPFRFYIDSKIPSFTKIDMVYFYSHFKYAFHKIRKDRLSISLFACCRFQPNINRIFFWCNKLRSIHLTILIACSYLFFQLPSMNKYPGDFAINSLMPESNQSSMLYNSFERAAMSKYCPISQLKKYRMFSFITFL